MRQARRKPSQSDVSGINDSLDVINKAIIDAKEYMRSHPWRKEPPDNIYKAFEFHSKLIDKIDAWTTSYMEKCGIMEIYESINSSRQKERKGQISGGIEEVLKSGKI